MTLSWLNLMLHLSKEMNVAFEISLLGQILLYVDTAHQGCSQIPKCVIANLGTQKNVLLFDSLHKQVLGNFIIY